MIEQSEDSNTYTIEATKKHEDETDKFWYFQFPHEEDCDLASRYFFSYEGRLEVKPVPKTENTLHQYGIPHTDASGVLAFLDKYNIRFLCTTRQSPEHTTQSIAILNEKEDITGDEIIALLDTYATVCARIPLDAILALCSQSYLPYQDLGKIDVACTQGLIQIAQQNADKYSKQLPALQTYRHLRKEIRQLFDISLNQSL